MPSFKITAAAVAMTLYTLGAHAQYTIDPSSVPISTRDGWCTTQKQSCPLLCTQVQGGSSTTSSNNCSPDSLTYTCVCGNGISPNASQISQTLPYFICTEYGNQCVTACNGNTDCQSNCRSQHPCGAQDPVRVNTSTSSVMPSTTGAGGASNTQVFNGLGGAAATTTSASGKKSDAQSVLDMGRSYGLAVVLSGIFAGFALVM